MPPGRYSKRGAIREIPPELQLLARVAQHVDDDMLREIAAADYGMQRDAYFSGLRVLRDECVLLPPDHDAGWDHEVLELIRWSRPERGDWRPGSVGERGHWMRLFCCVALVMRDVGTPEFNYVGAVNNHLGPMLDSIGVLDTALADAAIPFIEWATGRSDDPVDRAFLATAGLLLEYMRTAPDWERVRVAAHRLPEHIEAAWDCEIHAADDGNGWLLGLTHHDLRHDLWLPAIARCLLTPKEGMPQLLAKELEALALRLLPATATRARQFGLPEALVARYLD